MSAAATTRIQVLRHNKRNPLQRIASLVRIRAYRNTNVVDRFVELYQVPRSYALEVFEETKKWLWLCATSTNDPNAPSMKIYGVMTALDEMWHNFMLHSRDYEYFCDKFLGEFIHHTPTPKKIKKLTKLKLAKHRAQTIAETRGTMREYIAYVIEKLGRETAQLWFGKEERLSMRYLRNASVAAGDYWEDRVSPLVTQWRTSKMISFQTLDAAALPDPVPGARALVVGYANFSDALALASRGWQVVGVDPSIRGAAAYRQWSAEMGLASSIMGLTEDIRTASLTPLGKFDLVISSMMLHVLPRRDLRAVQRKLCDATAPGGLHVLSAFSSRDKLAGKNGVNANELLKLYAKARYGVLSFSEKPTKTPHCHENGEFHAGHIVINAKLRKIAGI